MIYRISLALLIVVLAIISTVNAFLTHGTGLVRMTRPFLSTSDGQNLQHQVQKPTATLDDQINQLESAISATRRQRDELPSSDRDIFIALTGEIAANTILLSTLKSQQGNLPHIFPFSFPILSITPFAQSLSTPHLLPFRSGNDAR